MATATVRKSGNSTVLVIPPEVIQEKKLKIGETVEFEIFKKADLRNFFGRGKHLSIDAQKTKNELRRSW